MRNTCKQDVFVFCVIVLNIYISKTAAETCVRNCGETFDTCSCHATCESLQLCCADYKQFCLDISPHSGSMLGGTDFTLLNVDFLQSDKLICRFRSEIETEGYVDREGRGHCISPLLYETGWIPFDVSTDEVVYNRSGIWLSVHPSKLKPAFKIRLVNATQWQYYGTHNTGGRLHMSWNPGLVEAEKVNVELWGYREIGGKNHSASARPEWMYLYSLGKDQPNSGSFSFTPSPAEEPHSEWDLGSIRVSPSINTDGARDVCALWSGAHALAWHLGKEFRQDPSAWALAKCLKWDELERNLPSFLKEIIDCPCTLAQARADTGRFHTDYGCDIETGSECTYHPGSVHCVRAIQASPRYSSGQQCCYDSTGFQVLTGDSIGGSTPDRAHDWGSPPYRHPPRVPGLSHWLHDVLSFYYCCLWSDNCHFYFTHRPSSDCRSYQPPKAGAVLGDPHFITFDGLSYTFNGKGEYDLVSSPEKELRVQIRTELLKGENVTSGRATRVTAVAMKEEASDVIEVRLTDQQGRLEVLRNQKLLSFSEQSWMDLEGVFLFSPTPQNVTVMFSSGVGVEVRAPQDAASLTVLLPQDFRNHTQGLLGLMSEDHKDELMTSEGKLFSPEMSSVEDLFNFGASWKLANETSLFTYDTEYLLETYYRAPKHDPTFIPSFSASELPDDPLLGEMVNMCSGEGSRICKFDVLSSRSLAMGNATLLSYQNHLSILKDLAPVKSCGWLPSPKRGQRQGLHYLEGKKVTFSCDSGYILFGSTERTCQNGQWSGEASYCLTDNTVGVVLGIGFSTAALITMAGMIVCHNRKQRRERREAFERKVVFEER